MSTDLLSAYRAGNQDSAEELVKTHLPLVRRVVGLPPR